VGCFLLPTTPTDASLPMVSSGEGRLRWAGAQDVAVCDSQCEEAEERHQDEREGARAGVDKTRLVRGF